MPKTMFLDEALKMWTPKDQDGDAPSGEASGEAKRKHDGEDEDAKSQAASAGAAGTKKQKVAAAANENPTGVAVVLFCVMNATLHVLGFQEDRHRWPDGVREEWDKLFLRNTGRGDFPSSPFQLYTDVSDDGLKVPGHAPWTRRECLRIMLLHMLGKGWCPVCVSEQFDVDDPSFDVFTQPFKEREKLGLVVSWRGHLCDQLTEETRTSLECYDCCQSAGRAHWHFITVPAENCRGKDMSTPERCAAEGQEGDARGSWAVERPERTKLRSARRASTRRACTRFSAMILWRCFTSPLPRSQVLADEFPRRRPHNWLAWSAIARDCEEKVKAYRETCKPCQYQSKIAMSVLEHQESSALAMLVLDTGRRACTVCRRCT